MWVGTTLVGIASECIVEEDRQRIVSRLRKTHEVIEFSNAQLQSFCGNALEVRGDADKRYLVLSERALNALDERQLEICHNHFEKLIYAPLGTLERYGGGSARCMLAELL